MSVAEELVRLLKLSPRNGEKEAAFALRLAVKANNISDDEWEGLSSVEGAQDWINNALSAIESKKPVPVLEGLAAVMGTPPAPPKPAPAPKKKAKPVDKSKVVLGPSGKHARAAKIKLLVKDNPHRAGAKNHKSFSLLENGMTVDEALAAGAPRSYLRFAERNEFLTVAEK